MSEKILRELRLKCNFKRIVLNPQIFSIAENSNTSRQVIIDSLIPSLIHVFKKLYGLFMMFPVRLPGTLDVKMKIISTYSWAHSPYWIINT